MKQLKYVMAAMVCFILFIPLAFASASRTFSKTTVSPSEQITISYSASDALSIREQVPSGWSFISGCDGIVSGICRKGMGGGTGSIVVQASSSTGTSTFNLGDYVVGAGTTYTKFTSQNVIISSQVTCASGQTQTCTASNGCSGTQPCSNNAWGACTSSLTKCSDGTCKSSCSSGASASRTFSKTTVSPSEQITISYSASDALSIREQVPSGWSFISGCDGIVSGICRKGMGGGTGSIVVQASSSTGTSTFNLGDYVVGAGTTYTKFTSQSVTVSSTPVDCSCAASTCLGSTCNNGQCSGTMTGCNDECPSGQIMCDGVCKTSCGTTIDFCAWTSWNKWAWFGSGSECVTAYGMVVVGLLVVGLLSNLGK